MDAEAIRIIVKEEIANAVAPSGLIGTAIDAPNEMLSAQVSDIVNRLDMLEKVESDMERANPFLAYEKKCAPEELLFAWKKLLIDQDVMSNFADQMADSAATNVMAAWCTNKSDPDLKNAPRTSWKMLCLSSHGGGAEKFRGFLSDKADDSDKTVACIARRCLAFYTILERQFTSLRSSKRNSASKIEGQKEELMLLVYHGIKHMKLKARKAAARNSSDLALMNLVFAPDIAVGLAKCVFESSSSLVSSARSYSNFDEPGPSHKRARHTVDLRSPSPRRSARQQKGGNAPSMDSLLDQISKMAKNKSSKDTNNFFEALLRAPETTKHMNVIKSKYCRQCLTAGRGLQTHGVNECRAAGNKPAGECPKCKDNGNPGQIHWAADCKIF
jgi:hypothetical protein